MTPNPINWTRKFVPPSVENKTVDLEGFVMIRPPGMDDILALGDEQEKQDADKMPSSQRSRHSFEFAKKYVPEVSFKTSEGVEIKNLDDLASCNLFLPTIKEIIAAVVKGEYGKKPIPSSP
jgi:hypothetical protein